MSGAASFAEGAEIVLSAFKLNNPTATYFHLITGPIWSLIIFIVNSFNEWQRRGHYDYVSVSDWNDWS